MFSFRHGHIGVASRHECSTLPAHEQWLFQQVTSGVFPSIEAAIAWAIEGMKPVADDDLEWARALLEAGEASVAQGHGIEGDAFLAALVRPIEALR